MNDIAARPLEAQVNLLRHENDALRERVSGAEQRAKGAEEQLATAFDVVRHVAENRVQFSASLLADAMDEGKRPTVARYIADVAAHRLLEITQRTRILGRAANIWRHKYHDLCARTGGLTPDTVIRADEDLECDLADRYAAAEALIVNQQIELARIKRQLSEVRACLREPNVNIHEEFRVSLLMVATDDGPSLRNLLLMSGPFNVWGWDPKAPPYLLPKYVAPDHLKP